MCNAEDNMELRLDIMKAMDSGDHKLVGSQIFMLSELKNGKR